MIELDVRIDRRDEARALRWLDPGRVAWAESQAVNRTAANVQTKALELVGEAMGISVSKLRKRGRGATARGKFGAVSRGRAARPKRLITAVTGYGRPFNVTRWGGQEIRAGASVSLKGRKRRGKGRVVGTTHRAYGREQTALRTWMLPSGAIVVRDGDSFRGVYGPGVAQQMETPEIMGALEREALKRFGEHFRDAVRFAFSPAGDRAVSGIRGSQR